MSASRWMTGIRPTIWSCCTGCTTICAHTATAITSNTAARWSGTFRCGELAIVVCKEYQNRHIGRHCVLELLKLAKEKGMAQVTANIYAFNTQSQRMFRSVGFAQTDKEWYAYTF